MSLHNQRHPKKHRSVSLHKGKRKAAYKKAEQNSETRGLLSVGILLVPFQPAACTPFPDSTSLKPDLKRGGTEEKENLVQEVVSEKKGWDLALLRICTY